MNSSSLSPLFITPAKLILSLMFSKEHTVRVPRLRRVQALNKAQEEHRLSLFLQHLPV
jgi:hypothetical protein